MKLNRSLMITILMFVLVICILILPSGCASLGHKKDAGSEIESPQQIDEQSSSQNETSRSSPEERKGPVAGTGGSGAKPRVQEAGLSAGRDVFNQYAASLKEGLNRILPKTLTGMNWNRVGTILGGIAAMSLIYGLAFGLGRLSLRRRGVGQPGGSGRTGEHAREPVTQ